MQTKLLSEVEQFMEATGLSEHRAGILLARNGRLVERLRENRRVWPETAAIIRSAIKAEMLRRGSTSAGAAQ